MNGSVSQKRVEAKSNEGRKAKGAVDRRGTRTSAAEVPGLQVNLSGTSVRPRSTAGRVHLETVHTVRRCAVQVNLPVRSRSTIVMIHLETVHTVHRSAGEPPCY